MAPVKIIDVDEKNLSKYPAKCFLNPKHEGYKIKQDWLKQNFKNGLRVKQLFSEEENKNVGFIEYTEGEHAWRAVNARDYFFIHCLWISPNSYKNKGYGSTLVKEVLREAKEMGKNGVAVITSEGSFMAGKDLFEKNGFTSVATVPPSFHLMVKTLKKGTMPTFNDPQKQLKKFKGINIVYSNQCPWVSRSINELGSVIKEQGLDVKITELKTPKEAQNAPSIYATFSLIYNGQLLEDHYISAKRFENIIKKEIKKIV